MPDQVMQSVGSVDALSQAQGMKIGTADVLSQLGKSPVDTAVGSNTFLDTMTTLTADGNVATVEETPTEIDFAADGSVNTFTEASVDVIEF